MTIWAKIGILAAYTVFIFGFSWHVHSKFDDADKFKSAVKQVDSAHKAESGIIKFNQDLGKNAKDACFNTPHSAAIGILLK